MSRPCTCQRTTPTWDEAAFLRGELCRLCWLYQYDESYRLFWDTTPRAINPMRSICLYLGEHLGYRDCPSCKGHVRQRVFACLHPGHAETTYRECARCADYAPADDCTSG